MSLRPQAVCSVPEQTARIARPAYPKGNIYLQLHDKLGTLYADADFADLYPRDGQPAYAPWRLALVSVMQFLENLSDRQAANAVRGRLDWKYLLSLSLDDAGFDHSVLAEVRCRLIAGNQELKIFEILLVRMRERGYVNARGRQRTDATHVLAQIRRLHRIEGVGETFRATLNTLAVAAPEWLMGQMQEQWIERYQHRIEDYRLPDGDQARQEYAFTVGNDGNRLLEAIYDERAPACIREIPAVQTLRQVWLQQFFGKRENCAGEKATIARLLGKVLTLRMTQKPITRKSVKQGGVGYKVHLTETCEEQAPHLITLVETTPAPTSDLTTLPTIHHSLHRHALLPLQHLVDTEYVDAEQLVVSQRDFGVDLFAPTREDYRWQARQSNGFAAEQFAVNWSKQCAMCPAGKTSSSWTPAQDRRGNPVIKFKFAVQDCGPFAHRQAWTQAKAASPRRTLTVRPQSNYQALGT